MHRPHTHKIWILWRKVGYGDGIGQEPLPSCPPALLLYRHPIGFTQRQQLPFASHSYFFHNLETDSLTLLDFYPHTEKLKILSKI